MRCGDHDDDRAFGQFHATHTVHDHDSTCLGPPPTKFLLHRLEFRDDLFVVGLVVEMCDAVTALVAVDRVVTHGAGEDHDGPAPWHQRPVVEDSDRQRLVGESDPSIGVRGLLHVGIVAVPTRASPWPSQPAPHRRPARGPSSPICHYSHLFVNDGRVPEPNPSGRDTTNHWPPRHERTWRHPSELGSATHAEIPGSPSLHRGIAVATAVATLLVLAGVTRLMVPPSVEQTAVVVDSTPLPVFRSPDGTESPSESLPNIPLAGSGSPSSPASPDVEDVQGPDSGTPRPVEVPATLGDASFTAIDASASTFAVAVQEGALYITTSAAVGDARSVSLLLDDRRVDAGVLLVDERTDIAILHITSAPIDPQLVDRFATNSQGGREGDSVTAIVGSNGAAPIAGVLGAGDDRHIELILDDRASDAGVTGDGAPVVDSAGHLIGLSSGAGTDARVLPVTAFVDALVAATGSSAVLDALGLEGNDITGDSAFSGIRVTQVGPGSAADVAGIVDDDQIVGFVDDPESGEPVASDETTRAVHSIADLTLDFAHASPGNVIGLLLERNGESRVVQITLDETLLSAFVR